MDPKELWGLSGAPIVIAIVQIIKTNWGLSSRQQVIAAAIVSLIVEIGIALLIQQELTTAVFFAVLVWLSAMGVWSGTKNVIPPAT